MVQEIITYVVVAAAVLVAVRFIFGLGRKKKSCACSCEGKTPSDDSDLCRGCTLQDVCRYRQR